LLEDANYNRLDRIEYENIIKSYSDVRYEIMDVSWEFQRTFDTEDSVAYTITAESGSMLQLDRLQEFLEEEIMKHDVFSKWVRLRASMPWTSNSGPRRWKAPRIFMVTGLRILKGADVSIDGTLMPSPAPVPDAVDSRDSEGSGHNDMRVWAAQFMEVFVEYGSDKDESSSVIELGTFPRTIEKVTLKNLASLEDFEVTLKT